MLVDELLKIIRELVHHYNIEPTVARWLIVKSLSWILSNFQILDLSDKTSGGSFILGNDLVQEFFCLSLMWN